MTVAARRKRELKKLVERINDVIDGYFKAFPEEKRQVGEAKPCKYEREAIMEFEKKRRTGKLKFVPFQD